MICISTHLMEPERYWTLFEPDEVRRNSDGGPKGY